MRRILNISTVIAVVLMLPACVFDNDMSYPRLKGDITAFAVEGQKEVTVNPDSLTVDVLLEETAEIDSLKLVEFAVSELAVADTVFGEYLNLTEPVQVMLSTYPGRDYLWTITASQPIERYVDCSGFVEAMFDPEALIAVVSVTQEQPLDEILINDMKLGPETSVIISTTGNDGAGAINVTRDVKFPMTLDCTMARKFTVVYKNVPSVWTVVFVQKKILNEIKSVDAWTYHAIVSGEFDGVGQPHFEYKKQEDTDWTVFDQVQVTGVTVSADITSLAESTDYLVRLVSGDTVGEEYAFTTETPAQLPGMGFNEWYAGGKNGNIWYPYAEGNNNPYWDTANPGVAILNAVTTVPETEHKVEGAAAAKMESIFVAKFAAGNIFTGKFLKFESMVASLEWGVPFTSRPYSLKGWYDYKPSIIDKYDATYKDVLGDSDKYLGKPDVMQIMVALVAEGTGKDTGPFPVFSDKPGKPVLTDDPNDSSIKQDPRVIAFGELLSSENTGGKYKEFELPLVYKEGDTRKPAYVIVVGCASYRGNFFTGGVGSTLYVDDFQFTYR